MTIKQTCYEPSVIVASCDHPGCEITQRARGVEHNGPMVEAIYGLEDWHLGEQDFCPEHRPPDDDSAA